MSENLRAVAEATESILDGHRDDALDGNSDPGWDEGGWARLASAGLTDAALSEAAGGGGGTLQEAAEVVRVAGSRGFRGPIAEHSLAATWLLEVAGIAVPAGIVTTALSTGGVRARADDSAGWILDGTARIGYGRIASGITVLADTAAGPLAVLLDSRQGELEPGRNLAGEFIDDLTLTATRVPKSAAALVRPEVVEQLLLRIALGRLLLCSGAATAVLSLTLRHVGEREQFGRPVARFQAVQQMVAELAGEVSALQIGADAALLAVESGASTAWLAVACARTDAEQSISRIATIAHQMHGAIGVTREHALHRFTLRLWSWREDAMTATAWAAAIADRVLTPGASSVWEQVVGS